jgi:hypothetical protein
LIILSIALQHYNKDQEEIPDHIVLTATIYNVTEYGGKDGSIDLTVTGGTSPYFYYWSNDQDTLDIDSLNASTYIASIADQQTIK